MFSLGKANNLINRLHEISIRIVRSDNESKFENLLEKNKEITIHPSNLQLLMTEVYKIINGYAAPTNHGYLFKRKYRKNSLKSRGSTHNLKNFQIILNKNKKRARYGSETIFYRTPQFKLANSLSEFNWKIKTWKCDTLVI